MSGILLKCEQSQSAKREIKLASCASRRPVTTALRNWRQYICRGCATLHGPYGTVRFRPGITQNGERMMAAATVF